MPGAGGIRAGRAFIELFVEDGKITPGLQRTLGKMRGFANSMTAIGKQVGAVGLGIVAALGGAATKASTFGSSIADLSQRVGITAESASMLAYAADQSATSIGTLEVGLRNMQKTVVAAAGGNQQAAAALNALGLSAAALTDLAPQDRLLLIAQSISEIDDPGLKAAAAMSVFGKAGAELIPLLDEGSSGIQALMDRATELNVVLSADSAAAAKTLGDQLASLQSQLASLAANVGSALIPALSDAAAKVEPLLHDTSEWVGRNSELVVAVGALGVALTSVGGVFTALGAIIKGTIATFAALSTFIVAHPYMAIVTAVGLLGAAFVSMGDDAAGAADEVKRLNELTKDSMSLLSAEDAAYQKEYLQRKEREQTAAAQEADATRKFWAQQDSAALAADPNTWAAVSGLMRGTNQDEIAKKGGWADVVSGGLGDTLRSVSSAIGQGLGTGVDVASQIAGALDQALSKASQTVGSSTAGTFNGALAAQTLGVHSPEKQIAENTKDTVEAVQDLTAKLVQLLPSFS